MPNYKTYMEQIRLLERMDFAATGTREIILNLIESLYKTIMEQSAEIQELRNEINRLKGEKGRPGIKPKQGKADKTDAAGKMQVPEDRKWKKSAKKDRIKIDRTKIVKLDKQGLPGDIEFKGYGKKIVQNIIIRTDNVLYLMEKYYSPSEKRTYTAKIGAGMDGTSYGAETKATILALYFENRVTEHKIASFLNANGLSISEGAVSDILVKEESGALTKIKDSIYEAGIRSSTYQQIDDTGMRKAGENCYATIVCNERYSAYFIRASKSRETVRTILTERLAGLFEVLVGDGAPQFKKIALLYALCWIHEERHYKKLLPVLGSHKEALSEARTGIWEYYDKLRDYKDEPTAEKKRKLSKEFDELFLRRTGYDDLDEKLALTYAKKNELLTVLDYPEVPLHNNLSESGLRELVVKRKISGGVKTEEGLKSWENNMTILATCKKLGVSFYDYIKGVFSKNISINLPELICPS